MLISANQSNNNLMDMQDMHSEYDNEVVPKSSIVISLTTGQIISLPSNIEDVIQRSQQCSIPILFAFQDADQCLVWNTVLYKQNLYLNLVSENNVMPAEYSKESFILLVESAELQLRCRNVILCLSKSAKIRPFNFLGFELLPPGHPLIPYDLSQDMIYMSYEIDQDDM